MRVLLQHDPSVKEQVVPDNNTRIVIYYPPHDYQIDSTDMVSFLKIPLFEYVQVYGSLLGLCLAAFTP